MPFLLPKTVRAENVSAFFAQISSKRSSANAGREKARCAIISQQPVNEQIYLNRSNDHVKPSDQAQPDMGLVAAALRALAQPGGRF